jgi:hypothetical protein
MVTSRGIREVITTLQDLQQRLGLVQTQSNDFFTEWTENLSALSTQELASLDRIKQHYDYHRADGRLLEGTIKGTSHFCKYPSKGNAILSEAKNLRLGHLPEILHCTPLRSG